MFRYVEVYMEMQLDYRCSYIVIHQTRSSTMEISIVIFFD